MAEKQNKQNLLKKIMRESDSKKRGEDYNSYVKQVTPKVNLLADMGKAFLVGGAICTLGQVLLKVFTGMGYSKEISGFYEITCLILLSVLLTGFGWYGPLVKFGGAGAVVPITGFANAVSSPAIEYQKEGQVFGIGCKIFTIAGPVILYGVVASWVCGLIYWVLKLFGVV